ncbi:MAG: UDP-glucose 4-epimerase GalE [Ignavibacteria bacterium]|jgi:UDP-glucose 4-epimerase
MDKNILVVGGAGYIGSHIVQLLCDKNYKVMVFDNFSTGFHENIDERVDEIVEGDIRSDNDLQKVLSKNIDVVFHFAASKAAGESMEKPVKYSDNNLIGTLNLLNKTIANNIKYFVFSSSAAVYGNPEYLPIDEKHPKDPTNYYGYTKLAIEQNLEWFSKLKGIKYSALRYFNATGYDINSKIKTREADTANLSPIVMEVACGIRERMKVFGNDYNTPDGTCIRDYIHVSDLAEAHVLAMNYIIAKDENLVVNLGSENGSSVLEVINAARKQTGKEINFDIVGRRAGDPGSLVASSKLANELLDWKSKYSDLDTIFKTMIPVYFK